MGNPTIDKILEKLGQDDLLDILAHKLTASELNSLLLEVYKMKAEALSPAELLKGYIASRFVKPVGTNPREYLQLESDFYRIAESLSFIPVELSPVAPLGTCSVIATVNQNKIISALRGTEVMADATNALALHICSLRKEMAAEGREGHNTIRYCTSHRLIRTQKFHIPGFSAHFKIFCMVTSGRDTGSYGFEKQQLLEHITAYKEIFKQLFHIEHIKVKLIKHGGYADTEGLAARVLNHIQDNVDGISIYTENQNSEQDNNYYKGIQFKLLVGIKGSEYEIVDGGFVDWSQKLLGNKKERMLISGMGVDFLLALMK
ncbi:MAG: hypothetical protein APF77_19320 [Clostridia bacterium BRH_c25]|nr:MAG: hypothetical protein APF77_19320 [Clostridia bacterium BRH_c25]